MHPSRRLYLEATSPWGRTWIRRAAVATTVGLLTVWAFSALIGWALRGSVWGTLLLLAAIALTGASAYRLLRWWGARPGSGAGPARPAPDVPAGTPSEGTGNGDGSGSSLPKRSDDATATCRPLRDLSGRAAFLEDRDGTGKTPLLRALDAGYARAAWELLRLGADAKAVDDQGHGTALTAIHGWKDRHDLDTLAWLLRALIEAGADPGRADRHGRSALHVAVTHDYLPIVELLLEQGVDPGAADDRGITPLHRAVAGGAMEVAELLIDRGAPIDAPDANGARPLHWAMFHLTRRRQEELYRRKRLLARRLIQRGAEVDLLAAIGFNLEERVRHALEAGDANLDSAPRLFDCDPLGLAVSYADADLVRLLLEHGADPEGRSFGQPALVTAADRADPEIVRVLLDAGARVDAVDTAHSTPLHHSVARGAVEVAELLLQHGSDPEIENDRGQTPISMARSHPALSQLFPGADALSREARETEGVTLDSEAARSPAESERSTSEPATSIRFEIVAGPD